MAIPLESLRSLPPGARFSDDEGRARVTARMHGDTLLVTARCDSLEALAFELTERLERSERQTGQEQRQTKPALASLATGTAWFLRGALAGAITTIIMALLVFTLKNKTKWKEKQETSSKDAT